MLQQMVTSGRLGRKSGRGFYTYEAAGSGTVVPDELTPSQTLPTQAVQVVGVVGSGAVAEELVSRLDEAGCAVTHVADASGDLSALSAVGLVIEAQEESPDPDEDELTGRDVDDLFAELGDVTAPGTLLATVNTYSAVALAAISGRPGETVVLRVHAPTPNGQVVEIGRTHATSPATLASLRAVVTALGAEPVVCRDRTGLVVDALLVPHLNDAVRMLDEGYADVEQIDTALRDGLGYPAGPFAIIDHIGADEVLAIAEELYSGTGGFQPHLAPSPLLVEHVLLDRPFTAAAERS
jgi:3-hydroxybutyryl-CoA dehydrogenase